MGSPTEALEELSGDFSFCLDSEYKSYIVNSSISISLKSVLSLTVIIAKKTRPPIFKGNANL